MLREKKSATGFGIFEEEKTKNNNLARHEVKLLLTERATTGMTNCMALDSIGLALAVNADCRALVINTNCNISLGT